MPNKNIIVLYHGGHCPDGFGAALGAYIRFGDNADYIAVNYNQAPPDVTGKEVFIVDFSYPRDVLVDMHSKAKSLLVLDHHKTAQESLAGLDYAVFDMDRSGAMLSWEYFLPEIEPPIFIQMLQDNDLWRFQLPHTKPFLAALRAFVPMELETWKSLVFHDINSLYSLIARGKDILTLQDKEIEDLLTKAHLITLAGVNGLACNSQQHHSVLGNRLAQLSGTFGVSYSYDGENQRWNYSLRSIGDFDCSEIARFYDGGGHRNSSGFVSDRLIGF